jgi:hypothetical protein
MRLDCGGRMQRAGGSRFCSHIGAKSGWIAAEESATPSLPEQATVTQRATGPTEE